MAGVAVVAHEWIGLPWAVAFTLGAVVSPIDALAATEIAARLGAPRRIVSLTRVRASSTTAPRWCSTRPP
jgi:monovalent cation/hydrogen antiporter